MTERTIVYTEEALFQRLVKLYEDAQVIKEDLKAVKGDFTYDEDDNPKALAKDQIKLVDKAAKLYVAAKFEETQAEALEVFNKYRELTDYN